MSRNKRRMPPGEITFVDACERVGAVLRGSVRNEIVAAALAAGTTSDALAVLRSAMRSHNFAAASNTFSLRRLVDKFDARSRREGLHVLEGWDYRLHKFPEDIVPVLLLDYCERLGIPAGREKQSLAILLDQYFLSILILLAVRVWDDGDPNENLDRITALLGDLHSPDGSGLRVVETAETLLLLAIAYYNPEEASFGVLMGKVRQLDEAHQLRVALPFAGILGSHLRFGLRFMYERDVARMREDNVVDYPMLLFTLVTLLRRYAHICDDNAKSMERGIVAEGLLNGLSSDPYMFTGAMPAFLAENRAEYEECRELIGRYRKQLMQDSEVHVPSNKAFSPLGFSCNFLSNAAVATVAIALGSANAAQQASLNALFTKERPGIAPEESADRLADRLMEFSSATPERLGAGGVPLIVYDPYDAVHWYNELGRWLGGS